MATNWLKLHPNRCQFHIDNLFSSQKKKIYFKLKYRNTKGRKKKKKKKESLVCGVIKKTIKTDYFKKGEGRDLLPLD